MNSIEPLAEDEDYASCLDATIDTLRTLWQTQHVAYHSVSCQDVAFTRISSVLGKSKDKRLFRIGDFPSEHWQQFCRIYSQVSSPVLLPIWRNGSLTGLVIAEDRSKDKDEATEHQLVACAPLITEALKQDERDQQQQLYQSFHAGVIKLARFAEGDLPREELDRLQGSDPPIGSSAIFGLGAHMIRDLFDKRAHTCIIFDATSIRYVPGDEAGTSVTDSTRSNDAKDYAAKAFSSDPESSAHSSKQRRASASFTGQTMDYIISSKGMGGEPLDSFLTANNILPPNNEDQATEADIIDDVVAARSASNTEQSKADEVLGATSGKVLCSYARSPFPVPLLAFASDGRVDADAMASLEGDKVRRAMAGYFASARQSEHGAQVFLEWGDDAQSDLRMRRLLGLEETGGSIMCAASVDANLQPSFWMLILFDHLPVYSRTETLLVEQVGIILSHSLLRKRARAVDFAQHLFMQKVQHELRTPLHAIIGVNETVSVAVKTAQSDRQSVQRRTDKNIQRRGKEDIKQVLTELGELSSSIAGSADQLSALVDDLVDFSLLQQNADRRKPFAHNAGGASIRSNTKDEDALSYADSAAAPVDVPSAVSLATLLSVLSTTVERCWSLFRRSPAVGDADVRQPPPPELIMSMDEMSSFDPTQARLVIDLDCLRRIVWKLVSNAIQYTEEGLITITIMLKRIDIKADVGLQVSQTSKSTSKKAYRMQFCVNDTGIGMSSDFLSGRIFQAYQQEDQDSVGIGLSLTLCRYLVDQMGGWIKAESQEGQGSTFTFSVPAHMTNRSKLDASTSDKRAQHGPMVRMAVLGFQQHKSLAMLQDAVTSHLNGVQVGSIAIKDEVLEIEHEIDVMLIAVDYMDGEGEADIIAKALESLKELPILIISLTRSLQHKYPSALWEHIEQVYNGRGASDLVRKLDRPLLMRQLDQLQEICEDARRCRIFRRGLDEDAAGENAEIAAGLSRPPKVAAQKSPASSLTSHDSTGGTSASVQDIPSSRRSSNEEDRTFKVLVVEDNPLNARIVTSLLTRARIPYLTAVDGVEAVQLFRKELPAVVLLDINMPRMNGFEAAKLMRAVESPMRHRIIAITALSAERDRIQGLDAGMDDWLVKPARLGPLIADLQQRQRNFDQRDADEQ